MIMEVREGSGHLEGEGEGYVGEGQEGGSVSEAQPKFRKHGS